MRLDTTLAARRQLREELRALVLEHPELTAPAAQARLSAALDEDSMSRKHEEIDTTDTDDGDGPPCLVGVRFTREERDALDKLVEHHKQEVAEIGHDPERVGASTVLRVLLRREATRLGIMGKGYKPKPAGRPRKGTQS